MVYVPIIAGENVLGVVSLQSYESGHVFPESDVRLLETLTNSMSVALQNAQSFKAEQERVAELQIINAIQQGLAAELDFQAIIDLVAINCAMCLGPMTSPSAGTMKKRIWSIFFTNMNMANGSASLLDLQLLVDLLTFFLETVNQSSAIPWKSWQEPVV